MNKMNKMNKMNEIKENLDDDDMSNMLYGFVSDKVKEYEST